MPLFNLRENEILFDRHFAAKTQPVEFGLSWFICCRLTLGNRRDPPLRPGKLSEHFGHVIVSFFLTRQRKSDAGQAENKKRQHQQVFKLWVYDVDV